MMPRAPVVAAALLSLVTSTASAQVPAGGKAQAIEPAVIGETFTIPSSVLHEVRRINVYLPPIYGDSSARLPVLYMPDGGLREDFIHVAGLVQVSVGNGTMRPFILVGIENTERRRDMTGPTDDPEDRRIAAHVGGSANFRRFIRDELMPRIRTQYRTTRETAVVGESLAGLFVVETLLREPDLFDTYIAIDPSLWWNKGQLVADASAMLRARRELRKTLFVTNSSEPVIASFTRRLATVLEAGTVSWLEHHYVPFPDETHGTIYHPAALRAFRMLFKPTTTR
jgi:predicted alpha/beta superfamily hydrolase